MHRRTSPVYFFTLALFLSLFGLRLSSAQVYGNISGMITDQSGAAVSGASVTAKSLDTGFSRTVQTDQSGRYRFFALPVGPYEVRVTKDGFAEAIRSGIRLVVGQDATVDLGLRVGQVSEQVVVTEDVSDREPDDARYIRVGRRTASQRSAAKRTQLRSAAYIESRNCELHLGKNRRHRCLQFDHRQQLFGLRKSPAAKHIPAERRGIYWRSRKQHATRRKQPGIAGC